jgi:hypothetical protein
MYGYADGLGEAFNGPRGFALNDNTAGALKRLRGELLGLPSSTIVLRGKDDNWQCHIHFQNEEGPRWGASAKSAEDVMLDLAQLIHKEK